MKLLGDLYEIDVAMLPIGDNFVMGPGDAVIAATMLKPKILIPMHYNTFDLIRQDDSLFKREIVEKTNSFCKIMKPGDHFPL